MQTLITVAPIFLLIAIGWIASRAGFIPDDIQTPLNRLIYYFAIPAFLFQAIANFPLVQGFNTAITLITLAAAALLYGLTWLTTRLFGVERGQAGSMVTGACHGNLGYIGLPVSFYVLGDVGLAQTGIIAGFLMILQNLLSVTVLQAGKADSGPHRLRTIAFQLGKNPVIISVLTGMLFSGLSLPIPTVFDTTLKMLGSLAPPAALLLIGASLSFTAIGRRPLAITAISMSKLVLLPGVGLLLFYLFDQPAADYLPGIILLATPAATVIYVLARQLGGDTEIAVSAISAGTLLSIITMPLWLALLT